MIYYLVANDSKGNISPRDRWKLFSGLAQALAWAESIGWEPNYGPIFQVGIDNVHQEGDKLITVIAVETDSNYVQECLCDADVVKENLMECPLHEKVSV
jgi:hypothetical protein